MYKTAGPPAVLARIVEYLIDMKSFGPPVDRSGDKARRPLPPRVAPRAPARLAGLLLLGAIPLGLAGCDRLKTPVAPPNCAYARDELDTLQAERRNAEIRKAQGVQRITPPANVLAVFKRQGTLFNLDLSRNEALATDAYIARLDEAIQEIAQACSNPNPTCTQVGSMLYCN